MKICQPSRRLHQEVPVFGHLSYLPNLAKIDEDERNLKGFVHEVELCEGLGLDRLVIHLGSRTDKDEGHNNDRAGNQLCS